jgi:hypothetical protein
MPIINIPSRNVQLNFPDTMSDEEIQSAIEKEYPRSGEDVAFDIDQAKNAALEGQNLVNPFEQMSNDDYVLYRKHLADKKTSFGDALGIAKDTFTNIINEVGTGIGATAYKLAQGDIGNVAESAGAGMVAGTVGLADIAGKILNPAKPIPSKEEFIGKPTTRLVDKPQQQGVTGLTYAWPSEEADVTNEDDYNKLIEAEKQRDAGIVNNLYAMELTMRGAPIEEVSRGFQYVDPTLLAGAGGALVKSAGKTLFAKGATKAALGTAGTVGTSTAPSAITQAGLGAIENTAGAIQGVAALPSRALEGVGRIAETVIPGSGVGAKATALTASAMGDLGLTAGVVGGAKATEKVAEVVGAAARIAKEEASRIGGLERVALDPNVSQAGRKFAAGLAQFQPLGRAVIDLTKGAAKGAAAGSVVGGALGGLAERNLEGVAAGFGAGGALGGLTGSLNSAFELGKEAVGKSTARTQQQAAGDINSFVATRPEVEQVAWSDTMAKLASQIGPERAASQLDAMRVAEASGGKVRIATLDEAKQWQAPGWVNIDGMEIVLNPEKIRGDTAAHESAHILFSSVINRAFRPEIETAIFGLADPISGEIVKPGILDDVALGKVAEQIRDAYGKNTVAANEFQGFANTLKNSTDADSLANARSRIADEIAATYTGRLFDRVRAGRFNPDRLPLVYRKVLSAIEDGVLDKFRSVMFEKGMDLGFDNVAKTFRNEKGKAIRIPELDAIVKKAYSQKLKVQDAENAKPDLIPVKPADRALWAKTYGGARGILNDNGTPKTQAQIDAEAAARWQDMTSRLSALPDSEKIGIDFSRDKSGKTVMTAKGQLSPTAINAILDSGALDQSAKAVLVEVLNSMQRADKSTFDTRYYGVYTRGKGGNKMVAGVKSASQNEILPYSVEINSKDGVLIRAVDVSKVRDRLATAMNKPEFKAAYDNPAEALKGFRKYLDNITQINAVDSATLLGGGVKGATRRNLFYDALGFRLRNNETLLNAPQSVINKSQNTIKSYRVERFAKLVDSGNKFAFEEATTYERALRNFQPDAFTPESLPNGEAFTNPDGFRILNKTGSKLFRTYDDTGKLIGVAESKEKAAKKAMDEASKRMAKEEVKANQPESSKRFQPVTPEQDAAYLQAVKAGDSETAQRLVDEAAFDQTGLSSEDVLRLIDRNSPSMALDYRAISKALGDKKYILEKVPVNSLRFEEGSENVVDAKRATPSKGPIIIGVDGVIVDGRHRAMLAKQNKQETISAYIPQNINPITYDDAGNVIPLSQRFNQASPDIRFQPISERELSTRWDLYPKTRGELTKPKILSALKGARNPPVSRDKLAKFVMSYDSPQDLMDHTYYHGTGNFISETVKPSITMSDRQAEQMGGGGYGEKYWAISLSKSKRKSEAFSGQSRSVRVHPVLLKKSAKVIEMPGIEDSADLSDHIIDLWKNQVDAVWIGGGEQELAVINPKALVFAKDADTYQVFGGFKSEDFTLEKAQEVMNQAAEVISNPESTIKIRFQPDPASPNILNGSDGSRIIKSNSGKYRVYLATGALAGVKDTLESAQKLIERKSK